MKSDPSLDLIETIRDSQTGKDYFGSIQKMTAADTEDCTAWSQKMDHFRNRRYCMEFRDPDYPWPGSSGIVMPLLDKKIDELKPQYLSLVTGANPPVTVLAIDRQSQENAGNVELWYEWLIKFGSPRYVENVTLAFDDMLEQGRGILKTIWHYETRKAAEILHRERLPERLRKLIVTKTGDPDALHVATGGKVPIIGLGEFDALKPEISKLLEDEYELDHESNYDKAGLSSILSWLRAGAKDPIRIEKLDIVKNVPGVYAVAPQDLILPSNATADIEQAERISEEMWFTDVQLRQKARDGEWNKEAVKVILDARKADSGSPRKYTFREADQAARDGISTMNSSSFNIKETACWYSTGEGKPDKKAVMLWSPMSPDIPLRFQEYVRPSGRWPWRTGTFELNKNRWYSARGICEKLDDIDYEITQQHRYKLNRATIATAPTIKFNPSSGINPATWRHIPGQMMPCRNPATDALPMEWPQLDVTFEREEQTLLTWAEQLLGGTDFGLASPLSRMSEPRTATEIGALGSRARQSLSMRGLLAQRWMQEIYEEMFDLWHAYGSKKTFVRVTGGEPIELTKEEMQGRFILMPTGTIGEQDPRMEEQRALQRLDVLTKVKPMLEPRYELDLGEVVADWLQKSDMRFSKRVLRRRSDQEVQVMLQQIRAQGDRNQALENQGNEKPEPPRPPFKGRDRQVPSPTFDRPGTVSAGRA